jgi:hypothetical protein
MAPEENANELVANATNPERPHRKSLKLEQILDLMFGTARYAEDVSVLEAGQTVAIQGTHGIGKASFIAEYCR